MRASSIQSAIAALLALWLPCFGAMAVAQTSHSQDKVNDTAQLQLFQEGKILSEDEIPVQTPQIPSSDILRLPGIEKLIDNSDTGDAWRAWHNEDYVKARLLAARAGVEGDARAQLLYGILLDHGLGGTPNPAGAVKWYRLAAEQKQQDALLALAGMSFAARGGLAPGDGRGFLQKAAELGDADAILALGRSHASGLGGALNENEAASWFQKAVNAGDNRGRVALGDLKLASGNISQALAYYRTAILGGDAEAAYKAGILRADEQSGVHNNEEAGAYLQTAARAGLPAAMSAYGIWLAGQSPALPAQAARWLRKSAELNDPEGQYLYAIALARGEGVLQDREQAYEWAVRAHINVREDEDYRQLSEVLGLSLMPVVRQRIHASAQMPLLIARGPAGAVLQGVDAAGNMINDQAEAQATKATTAPFALTE